MTLPELKLETTEQAESLIQKTPLVLSASAGTGKTFSLVTFALGFLGQGISRPHELMGMSFTNDAASDLKDRIVEPLEKVARLSKQDWQSLLESLPQPAVPSDWTNWDQAIEKKLKIGKEFAHAARQWGLLNGEQRPKWTEDAAAARSYWISIRREAQSIPVTTIHGAAFGITGGSEKDIIDCKHPKLIRLLKSVCRSTYSSLSYGLGDEILNAFYSDEQWAKMAQVYDSFVDGQGDWRTEWEKLDDLETTGGELVTSFNKLVENPDALGKITAAGNLDKRFVAIKPKLKKQSIEKKGSDLIRQIDWIINLFINTSGDNKGELKAYFVNETLKDFVEKLKEYVSLLERHVSQASEKALINFAKKKKENHLTTYGDIIRGACEYLKTNPLPNPPKLLLVDEYQDTNPMQELFLSRLCPSFRKIIVGDTKQAIYSFRGGDSSLLLNEIKKATETGSAYSLLTNYRSLKPIVKLGNYVVSNIFPKIINAYTAYDGEVQTDPTALDPGKFITIGITRVKAESNHEGGLTPAFSPWIADLALDAGWDQKGFFVVPPKSDKPKSTRALLLPARAGAKKLLHYLRQQGIVALLYSEEGRLNSPGIRLMNALLGFFAEPEEPRHLFVLFRSPWVGMTNQQLVQAARLFKSKDLKHNFDRLDCLLGQLPSDLASCRGGLDWLASLKGHTTARILSEALTRQPGVLELIHALRHLGRLEVERAQRNLEEWLTAAQDLSDSPSVAYFQIQESYQSSDKGDAPLDESSIDLIISTIHQSKGLQFDSVILPLSRQKVHGKPKGSLNMKLLDKANKTKEFSMCWNLGGLEGKQYTQGKEFNDQKELESFANQFYVAITRSKYRLMFIQLDQKKKISDIETEVLEELNEIQKQLKAKYKDKYDEGKENIKTLFKKDKETQKIKLDELKEEKKKFDDKLTLEKTAFTTALKDKLKLEKEAFTTALQELKPDIEFSQLPALFPADETKVKKKSTDWMVLGAEIRDSNCGVKIFDTTTLEPQQAHNDSDERQSSKSSAPNHPTDVERPQEYSHHASSEVDQARREGIALHEVVRELLLHPDGVSHQDVWLEGYKGIPTYNKILPQARSCIKTLEKQGWLGFPRRTEYPLEGTAVSLGTGFADLVMWKSNRINPDEVIVVDYKRSIPEGQLDSYKQQVRRYINRLQENHPEATIKGFLYDAKEDALTEVTAD